LAQEKEMSIYQFCPPPDLTTNEQTHATWSGGFSDSEIASVIELGNAAMKNEAGIVGVNKTDQKIRKSTVSWINCNQQSTFLYDKLGYIARMLNGQFFEFDLYGFVEDFQYTVYQAGGDHYDWHIDKGNTNISPRKLSLVVQLSDPSEYDGGELLLNLGGKEIITAEKKKGLIYAFPSWVLHKVTPVTAGTRKSLVVWIAGPKFR